MRLKLVYFFFLTFLFIPKGQAQFKQEILPFYDMETHLYGYKDSLLNMCAIPARYEYADRYYEQRARVFLNGKYGFLNCAGEEIIPLIYDDALNVSEGLIAVKLNEKWGFVDCMGKEVIPFKYELANHFSEQKAAVLFDGKWGFINKENKLIIPSQYEYDEAEYPLFRGGLVNMKQNSFWGYINEKGEKQIAFKYDYALPFDGETAAVSIDGQWGFIDKSGKEITEIKYSIVDPYFPIFKDGLLAVKFDERFGYINTKGEEIIPLIYDYVSIFEQGKALVRLGSEYFHIDINGNRID